ncbi:hypothetical protein BDK51DRAFT_34882, partial [Blyttiomyces helicus]
MEDATLAWLCPTPDPSLPARPRPAKIPGLPSRTTRSHPRPARRAPAQPHPERAPGPPCTFATLRPDDRRRLATLVQRLASAEAQKLRLADAVEELRTAREGIASELAKCIETNVGIAGEKEELSRKLQNAQTLLSQYEQELQNTKAKIQSLQQEQGPAVEVGVWRDDASG